MNARKLFIVAIVALLMCFAPSPAYADLFSELEDYDGDMWRNNVSEDAYYGSSTSTEYGSLSVQLILSDIYQYNTDLLARAQSPAAQLAVQLTQLDFIRGAYGRLTQIKNYVMASDSKLYDIRTHTHDMKLTLDGLYTYVIDIDDKVETAADKLTSIKSDTQALNSNLDLVVESINTFGVIQQGISDKLSNVYTRQQSILTSLNSFKNDNHSDLHSIHQDGLTTNDYLNSFDEYLDGLSTDLGNVLLSLSDVVDNQQEIITALQNLDFSVTFPNSISIDNWPEWPSFQPIIDSINSLKTSFDTLSSKMNFVNTGYSYLRVYLNPNNPLNIGNFPSFSPIIDAINGKDLSVDIPNSISIDNWPEWPSFQPIIDSINSLKTSFDTLSSKLNFVNTGYSYLRVYLNPDIPLNIGNYPSFSPIVDAINAFKASFDTLASKFNFLNSGYSYLRVYLSDDRNPDGTSPFFTVRDLNDNFSELFNYLTNQDGLLKQIRDLLNVSNPDELVGDFDSVEFDTNVDDLVSRLATVAPFGALLMVSAELDILHSVSAIQNPSFVFPFEFFGQDSVTIDLSFMADARPLFNFVVVFGFVYMLLIYSIDFIKEGEL